MQRVKDCGKKPDKSNVLITSNKVVRQVIQILYDVSIFDDTDIIDH